MRKADGMSFLITNFITGRHQVEIPACGSIEVEYRFLTTTTSKTVRGDCNLTGEDKAWTVNKAEARHYLDNSRTSQVTIVIGYGLVAIICALVVALVHVKKSESRSSVGTGEGDERYDQVPDNNQLWARPYDLLVRFHINIY